MKEIDLKRGYVTLVDDEDFEWLNKFQWQACVHKSGYIHAKKGSTKESRFTIMSRMIMGVTDRSIIVDHKDRNPLNNQRYNLRLCSQAQNSFNCTNTKGSSSKYLGVSWSGDRNKWEAKISRNRKTIHLGRHITEYDAALAYNKKAIELFGEFANLNKV